MKSCVYICVLVLLSGCTRDTMVDSPPPVSTESGPKEEKVVALADPPVEAPVEVAEPIAVGTVTVLAFEGLKEPLEVLAKAFESRHPGLKVVIESSELIAAIRRLGTDETVDLLVTEGATAMEVVRPADVVDVDSIRVVTHVPLTVSIAPKNKERFSGVDTLKEGVRVGLLDPRVSTGGRAAQRFVRRLKLGEQVNQRVLPGGAKKALLEGVVDVFVGWGRVDETFPVMPLPASARELLPITAARTKRSQNKDGAAAFLAWTRSNEAAALWRRFATVPTPTAHAPIVSSILPAVLPGPRYWSSALTIGERILLTGGRVGNQDLKSLVWFDPAKTLCTSAQAQLPTGRHGVASLRLRDARIVVAGGLSGEAAESDLYLYNVSEDRLDRQNVDLPVPVGRMASAAFDDVLVFFGGVGADGELKNTVQRVMLDESTVDILDTQLPSPRADMAIARVSDNKVLLVGGKTKQGPTAEILEFSTETHVIRRLPQRVKRPLADMAAVEVDGQWLVFGGQRFGTLSDTVLELSEAGDTSFLSQRLPYPVRGGSVAALNERVYILGGITSDRIEHRIVRWPW